MKYKYLIFIFLIHFLFTSGCKKEKPIEEPFFTFGKVGNEWTFQRTHIDDFPIDTIIDTVKYVIISNFATNLFSAQFKTKTQIYNFTWFISGDSFGVLREDGKSKRKVTSEQLG